MSHLSEDEYGVQLTWNTGKGAGTRSWEVQVLPFNARHASAGQATFSIYQTYGDYDYVVGRIPSIAVARKLSELYARAAELMDAEFRARNIAAQDDDDGDEHLGLGHVGEQQRQDDWLDTRFDIPDEGMGDCPW